MQYHSLAYIHSFSIIFCLFSSGQEGDARRDHAQRKKLSRNREELWMIEQMDDKRRKKESNRSRPMEDHGYSVDGTERSKGFDLDLQWMIDVENGENM